MVIFETFLHQAVAFVRFLTPQTLTHLFIATVATWPFISYATESPPFLTAIGFVTW